VEVARELEGYEVERFRQMGRHLDLMWNLGKVCLSLAFHIDSSNQHGWLRRLPLSLIPELAGSCE